MRGLSGAQIWLLRAMRQIVSGNEESPDWINAIVGRGPMLVIEDFLVTPWASLTFRGMRHQLNVRIEGEEAQVAVAERRIA